MENYECYSSPPLPSKRPTLNLDEMDHHFASTAEKILNKTATPIKGIYKIILKEGLNRQKHVRENGGGGSHFRHIGECVLNE